MSMAAVSSMLTPALRSELLEALRPWLRVLRERTFPSGAYDMDRLAPDDVIWLRLPATWEVDLRVFEAFELLALAGRVDYELWRLALSHAITGRSFRVSGSRTGVSARDVGCLLSFNGIDEFPNAILAWSGRVVAGADRSTASHEYTDARDWLESLCCEACEDNECTERCPLLSIRIPVKMWLHEGSYEERLQQLAQVASSEQHRDNVSALRSAESPWRSLFRLVEMDPGTPDVVTAAAFAAMTEIVSRGILIDKLKPNGMVVTKETAAMFAHGLYQVFAISTDTKGATVTIVELPRFLHRRTVTALFSALRVSRSVRMLEINCALSPWQPDPEDTPLLDRSERDHLWRWIAFSVFGRYAAHCLDQVSVNVEHLTADEVRAFRDQLEQAQCVPPDTTNERATRLEIVGASIVSKFCATCPVGSTPDTSCVSLMDLPPQEVLVVGRKESDWFRVLVPGHGLAWSKPEDLAAPFDAIALPHRPAFRLVLAHVTNQSMAPVLALLQLVGKAISSVKLLQTNLSTAIDDWISGVLDACPRLESFTILSPIRIQSMAMFTDRLVRGTWGIERLKLSRLRVVDLHSFAGFFYSLAALDHATSRIVNSIQLTVTSIDDVASGFTIVHAASAALRGNHTLRELTLTLSFVPRVRPTLDLVTAVKHITSVHNLEAIAVRRGPLGHRRKLAFLSLVHGPEIDRDDNRLWQLIRALDRPLIALVFEFAAACERRRVALRLAEDDE